MRMQEGLEYHEGDNLREPEPCNTYLIQPYRFTDSFITLGADNS